MHQRLQTDAQRAGREDAYPLPTCLRSLNWLPRIKLIPFFSCGDHAFTKIRLLQSRTNPAELLLCSPSGLFTQAHTARLDCQRVCVFLCRQLCGELISPFNSLHLLRSDAAGAQRRSACAANLSQQDIKLNDTHTHSAWSAIGGTSVHTWHVCVDQSEGTSPPYTQLLLW